MIALLLQATLDILVGGCSHVAADIANPSSFPGETQGRESLARVCRLARGVGSYDVMPAGIDTFIHGGDESAHQNDYPESEEAEFLRQAAICDALGITVKRVKGNHDATLRHSTPVPYRVNRGNVAFLILPDHNEVAAPAGRQGLTSFGGGGRPAGAMTAADFAWLQSEAASAKAAGYIVVPVHHHALRETTYLSHDFGGRKPDGSAWVHGGTTATDKEGGSYLAWFIEADGTAIFKDARVETWVYTSGLVDAWIGFHSHYDPRLTDVNGRGHIEVKNGVVFINAAGLSYYHNNANAMATAVPHVLLLTFTENSPDLLIRNYWESTKSGTAIGWDSPRDRTVTLGTAYVP